MAGPVETLWSTPPWDASDASPAQDIFTIQSQLGRPLSTPRVKLQGLTIAGPVKAFWPAPPWEARRAAPARDIHTIQSQLGRPMSTPHVKLHGIPTKGPPREARDADPARDILSIQSQHGRPMSTPHLKLHSMPIAGLVKTLWRPSLGRPGGRLPLETSSPFSRNSGGQCPLHT